MLKLIARLGLSSAVWGAIGLLSAAHAQIVRDTTLPTNSEVLTTGNDATIRGGTQVGGNLFHSFERFSVPTNGSAFFDNALTVQNIISRVTGALPSSIDGTIRANGTANLFLINPNGILFGENARLNIGGSFVASTANAIRFGETGLFSASDPSSRPLLNVNPSTLLFTTLQSPAGIVSRSRVDDNGLQVAIGKSLVLVGGDVRIDGGLLYAPGGRLEVGGISQTGSIGLKVDGNDLRLNFPEGVERSDISFVNGALGGTPGTTGGDIVIHARNLTFSDRSGLVAGIILGESLESQAGDILINATGTIRIDSLSRILNSVFSDAIGNSGRIYINTGSLVITDGGRVATNVLGEGKAGEIVIEARDRVSLEGFNASEGVVSIISGGVAPGQIGQGGNIRINTGSLSILQAARIDSRTFGQGNAGDITIEAHSIEIEGISTDNDYMTGITSQVESEAIGQGGNVTIRTGSLLGTQRSSVTASTLGTGSAGSIDLQADQLVLKDSLIGSNVQAKDAIGNGGTVKITSGSIIAQDGAQVNAYTRGQGRGGAIWIEADSIIFDGVNGKDDTSSINSNVELTGKGSGGSIDITSDFLAFTNGANLNSETSGSGNAGNININTQRLSLQSKSFISSDTYSEGRSGTVSIQARDSVNVSNSYILANTFSSGFGGDLSIQAGNLIVKNDSRVQADTYSNGNAGGLTINVKTLKISESQVSSSTLGSGDAGRLTVRASEFVELTGEVPFDGTRGYPGGLLAQVDINGTGRGGNLSIETQRLSVSNGSKVQVANFGQAKSTGNLFIRAKEIDVFNTSDSNNFYSTSINAGATADAVSLTPPRGDAGIIRIETERLSVRNGGRVESGTDGSGNAGQLTILARDLVEVGGTDHQGRQAAIRASVSPTATGRGGDIEIKAGRIKLDDGNISVSSTGTGQAGNLSIEARESIYLNNQSQIIAQTQADNSGDITLRSGGFVLLRRGSQISTTAGTAQAGGNGGNIEISTPSLIAMPLENSDITARAFTGKGGNIQVNAQAIYGFQSSSTPTNLSEINASSQLGISGNVTLNTPDIDPSRGTIELPATVLDLSNQISQTCAPQKAIASSFIRSGRGSLPPSPLDTLQGEPTSPELATVGSNSETYSDRISSLPNASSIIEAQGWVKDAQGKVTLVANSNTATTYLQTLGSCH